VLVCTHATIRIAVEKFGVEIFDERLIAVDEACKTGQSLMSVVGGLRFVLSI